MDIKNVFVISCFAVLLAVPFLGMAQVSMPSIWPSGYWAQDGILSCTGYYAVKGLIQSAPSAGPAKTCTSIDDLIQTFLNIVSFAMTLALFIFAPALLAWGGLMIVISAGSPGRLQSGKKILTGTLIGVVIVLAAYLIVETFVTLLGIAGIGGFPLKK